MLSTVASVLRCWWVEYRMATTRARHPRSHHHQASIFATMKNIYVASVHFLLLNSRNAVNIQEIHSRNVVNKHSRNSFMNVVNIQEIHS